MMVNYYRKYEGKTTVIRNAVMFAFHRMMPTITRIKKRSQCNVNHEAWKKTDDRQTNQVSIMLGKIKLEDLQNEFDNLPIPSYYDPSLLPKITREHIVFFDKVHIEQDGGSLIHDKTTNMIPSRS